MNKEQYEQEQKYLRERETHTQMSLEAQMGDLTRSLSVYRITNNTVISTLETEIKPLKYRLDMLLNQITNLK